MKKQRTRKDSLKEILYNHFKYNRKRTDDIIKWYNSYIRYREDKGNVTKLRNLFVLTKQGNSIDDIITKINGFNQEYLNVSLEQLRNYLTLYEADRTRYLSYFFNMNNKNIEKISDKLLSSEVLARLKMRDLHAIKYLKKEIKHTEIRYNGRIATLFSLPDFNRFIIKRFGSPNVILYRSEEMKEITGLHVEYIDIIAERYDVGAKINGRKKDRYLFTTKDILKLKKTWERYKKEIPKIIENNKNNKKYKQ